MPRITVAKALLILMAAEAAVISTNEEVASAVENICQEIYFLGELDKRLQQVGTSGSPAKARNKSQANSWKRAAAAVEDPTKRCLYHALSEQLITELRKIEASRQNLGQAATDARLAIARHRGLLEAMQQTANRKIVEVANKHSNPDRNTVKLTLSLADSGTPTCKQPKTVTEVEAGKTAIDWDKLAKIKLSDPTALHKQFHKATIQLDAFTLCQGNQAAETQTLQNVFKSCAG
uniref:Variant surface glycoprotein n=1 Tax=Trypanosoma brucei TaxID=5691 RepID=A0A1V0FZ76_9TRYP|nr:variant surface glycoprotein [Trypanosoma brucei]